MNKEYMEDMLAVFKNIYEDEVRREESIHHSASLLLIAEGTVLGASVIGAAVLAASQAAMMSMADLICFLASIGALFGSMVVGILAQWHVSRDKITNSEMIQVQMQESPESFKEEGQRLQYAMDIYTRVNADLQKDNTVLNHRLRSSGITFLAGAGILAAASVVILFGI